MDKTAWKDNSQVALKIAGVYLLIGSLWILFSDRAAAAIAPNEDALAELSLYKGWGFMIVTAGLLYWLVLRHTRRMSIADRNFRLVAENASDVIWILDPAAGRFKYVSPSVQRMLGYTPEEVLARPPSAVLLPDSLEHLTALFRERLARFRAQGAGTVSFVDEFDQPHKDGSILRTEVTTAYLFNEQKQVEIVGVTRNLSQRKQTEERLRAQEQRFRALIENGLDNISLLAADGTLIWENPAVNRTLGYQEDEFVNRNIFELMHPDDLGWTSMLFTRLTQEPGRQERGVFRLRHSDGSWRWVEATATNLLDDPDVGAVVINYRDITERKGAEIELRHRNDDLALLNAINAAVIRGESLDEIVNLLAKELRRIFACEGCAIYRLDPDGTSLTMQQYSFTPETVRRIEQLIGSTIPLLQFPIREGGHFQRALSSGRGVIIDAPQQIQTWMAEFVETPFLPLVTREFIRSLIPQVYNLLNIKSILAVPLISQGNIIGILDVSSSRLFIEEDLRRIESFSGQLTAAIQRQQADVRVRRSEEFLQSIQDALSASIVILDQDGVIVQVNSAWRKFAEQNGLAHPGYGIGLNYLEVCDAATGADAGQAPLVAGAIREILAGQRREAQFEYPCHSPEEQRWFNLQITKFEDGAQVWVVLAHENITQRKQVEQALRESEAKYRLLFENNPLPMWIYDLETLRFLKVNEAAIAHYGYSDEEFMSMTIKDIRPPEDVPGLLENIAHITRGIDRAGVWRHRKKDGSLIYVEIISHVVNFDGRRCELVLVNDVTERMKAEQELRLSEERFRQLANNIQEVFWMTDAATGEEIYISPAAEKIWGRSVKAMLDDPTAFIETVFPEDRPMVLQTLEIQRSGKNTEMEYRITRPDGSVCWIWDRAFPIFDETGKVARLAGIAADITERKQMEQALRQSEERYRGLFENLVIGFALHEIITNEAGEPVDYIFLEINPMFEKLTGISAKQTLGRRVTEILPGIESEAFIQTYGRVALTGEPVRLEEYSAALGKYYEINAYSPARGQFAVTFTDVTERKQIEQALRENEQKLQDIIQHSSSMFYTHTTDHVLTYVSPQSRQILDCEPEEAMQRWQEWLSDHPANLLGIKATERAIRTGKRQPPYELELITHTKRRIWVRVDESPVIQDGKTIAITGSLTDITELKQAEVDTRRHLAELEALYENGLAVGRLLQPQEIGELIIATFGNHLSWHHVTIRLRKGDSDELELIAYNLPHMDGATVEAAEKQFKSHVSRAGQGISGWVVQAGEPVRTGNLQEHPQYVNTYEGMQSGLYMPLKIGDRVIGVISVESEKPDAFTAQDERLLATLANQAAIAFENARLYQAAQQELAERKRAEAALRTSETHYRELADSITDVFFELDQDLNYTYWNKASELLTGIFAREAVGKSMRDIFGDSEEQVRIERIYRSVLATRRPKTFEAVLVLNQQERSFEINAYPSTRGVSVVAKDVTERQRAATLMQKRFELMEYAAAHSLSELMQKALDEICEWTHSAIGFFQFVEDDQVTLGLQIWSTDTFRHFHNSESELGHRSVDQAGVWAEAIRQRRAVIHNEYESLPGRKDLPEGHPPVRRELILPILRNEKIVAVMGIGNKSQEYTRGDLEVIERFADYAWDIVERKQMELALAEERHQLARRVDERTVELIRANSNLARALRVKDEFLANMSHELRTPLNAILGLSESLAEQIAGPLNEKQLKYITTIGESGHHLLSLINDILDLAKIEAGQITLDINKVDVNSVCQSSVRMVRQLAQKKNQEVALDVEPGVEVVWADERRLKQMMVNLLSNAVKFTPEGGRLGLEIRGDREGNKVAITVWDDGIGIHENDLSRLFKPFVQLDAGLARESSGTGLGLALVAQMARLHGGSVSVTSEPGRGSRFTIELPWEPALALDAVERMKITGKFHGIKPGVRQPTILVIEDTQDVVMMLRDYLEMQGYKVVTAQDGLDGMAQAKLAHPDLILMDVQMPRMDGLEATQKLREDPGFRHTPIIALTALAMPSDRERCLAAGMDEYISKPVNLKALIKLIQKFLSARKEPASRP